MAYCPMNIPWRSHSQPFIVGLKSSILAVFSLCALIVIEKIPTLSKSQSGWATLLKNMSSSLGIIIPNIYEKTQTWQPNHQPGMETPQMDENWGYPHDFGNLPWSSFIISYPYYIRVCWWLRNPASLGTTWSGWWFEPLWKILVNWDDYSQYMGT